MEGAEAMNTQSTVREAACDRTIVLRRFAGEAVELVAIAAPPAMTGLVAAPGCRIAAWAEGDSWVYRVVLPEGYSLRPVDWRRFATDEAKLRELLVRCLQDNLEDALFEPWTAAWRDRAAARLRLALQDLSSMFEVVEIEIEPGEEAGDRQVRIQGRDVRRQVFHLALLLRAP